MFRAKPFRWHFAPVMTLILRYLLIAFAFTDAFTQWSNSNTNATCAVQSALFAVTNILISTCAVLAMAWRTNAVVRGVIQGRSMRLSVQALLFLLMMANIAMNWVFLIQAQFTGSWSAYAFHGVCTTKANDEPVGSHPVTDDTEFWYYVVSILFDAYCALTITLALHRLARHSHGFSKLIQQYVSPPPILRAPGSDRASPPPDWCCTVSGTWRSSSCSCYWASSGCEYRTHSGLRTSSRSSRVPLWCASSFQSRNRRSVRTIQTRILRARWSIRILANPMSLAQECPTRQRAQRRSANAYHRPASRAVAGVAAHLAWESKATPATHRSGIPTACVPRHMRPTRA